MTRGQPWLWDRPMVWREFGASLCGSGPDYGLLNDFHLSGVNVLIALCHCPSSDFDGTFTLDVATTSGYVDLAGYWHPWKSTSKTPHAGNEGRSHRTSDGSLDPSTSNRRFREQPETQTIILHEGR